MRLRNLKDTDEILSSSDLLIKDPVNYKGKYKELFGNNNHIHIEIGMGKGDFISGMAEAFPNINFIGIEKYGSIMARAIKKIQGKEFSNLKLLNIDATTLSDVFDKEIDLIYLNFSDPWPKKRYHKRRLTHENLLKIYDFIFKKDAVIEMKTDNIDLFNDSLEYLKEYGYQIIEKSNDLHTLKKFNIMTEYETKFSALGIKINYLKAIKK